MKSLDDKDFPVYLHTHPASIRAIKLYSDVGFCFITDPIIGYRRNDLIDCLPYLKQYLNTDTFNRLNFTKAPKHFLQIVKSITTNQF